MAQYYSLVTDTGLAKLAAANVSGTPLQITHIALGDANDLPFIPAATQTALVNEIRRDAVNRVYQHTTDPTIFVTEGFLPKSIGGFTIREVGLFDSDGDLIVTASYPDTYKALEIEGGASDMYVSAMFKHSNTVDVAISTDPSLILATQQWSDVRFRGAAYDVIVGSTAEVLNGDATHEISGLNDVSVPAGSKVLFLDGTHLLTVNLTLSNPDVELISESSEAIIDVATFQINLSGARNIAKLRIINAGAGDVIVSGTGSRFFGIDMAVSELLPSASVTVETSGVDSGEIVNGNLVDAFPSGTRMLFQQSIAPVGWTKDVTHDDKALRIVSGNVVGGGSVAFSSVFSIMATDNHVLTIAQMPSHTHQYGNNGQQANAGGTGVKDGDNAGNLTTSSSGGNEGHSHNMDISVQYVDAIIASKD